LLRAVAVVDHLEITQENMVVQADLVVAVVAVEQDMGLAALLFLGRVILAEVVFLLAHLILVAAVAVRLRQEQMLLEQRGVRVGMVFCFTDHIMAVAVAVVLFHPEQEMVVRVGVVQAQTMTVKLLTDLLIPVGVVEAVVLCLETQMVVMADQVLL
jgi:hypothetical protein